MTLAATTDPRAQRALRLGNDATTCGRSVARHSSTRPSRRPTNPVRYGDIKTYASQLLAGTLEAPDREGTRHQLHDWFRPESAFETRVAVFDNAPIGHVTVRGHQLVHLFVDPGHQGTGLGRRLLARGEALIAAGGHREIELHARVDNTAAIAFYEQAGWTVTDRVIHTVEHGISYDEHVLVKQRR